MNSTLEPKTYFRDYTSIIAFFHLPPAEPQVTMKRKDDSSITLPIEAISPFVLDQFFFERGSHYTTSMFYQRAGVDSSIFDKETTEPGEIIVKKKKKKRRKRDQRKNCKLCGFHMKPLSEGIDFPENCTHYFHPECWEKIHCCPICHPEEYLLKAQEILELKDSIVKKRKSEREEKLQNGEEMVGKRKEREENDEEEGEIGEMKERAVEEIEDREVEIERRSKMGSDEVVEKVDGMWIISFKDE